jgi:hypothetical protein
MRMIRKPVYCAQTVFQLCIESITNMELRDRLIFITPHIVAAANNYEEKASGCELYRITANNNKNDDIVVGTVKKIELKNVYTQQMSVASKPARQIYDEIMSLAHMGICPYCGFGQARTLDHYLPKAKFPFLSVLPINLVPSCRDCNTGKKSEIALTAEQQPLHPYFDNARFISEQWLFAQVWETSPVSIRFYVDPPQHWDDISKQRVRTHFQNFNLANRFSIEVGPVFSSLRDLILNYFSGRDRDAVKQFLHAQAQSEYSNHCNSWKTATYQALAENEWYCGGGYQ